MLLKQKRKVGKGNISQDKIVFDYHTIFPTLRKILFLINIGKHINLLKINEFI